MAASLPGSTSVGSHSIQSAKAADETECSGSQFDFGDFAVGDFEILQRNPIYRENLIIFIYLSQFVQKNFTIMLV